MVEVKASDAFFSSNVAHPDINLQALGSDVLLFFSKFTISKGFLPVFWFVPYTREV